MSTDDEAGGRIGEQGGRIRDGAGRIREAGALLLLVATVAVGATLALELDSAWEPEEEPDGFDGAERARVSAAGAWPAAGGGAVAGARAQSAAGALSVMDAGPLPAARRQAAFFLRWRPPLPAGSGMDHETLPALPADPAGDAGSAVGTGDAVGAPDASLQASAPLSPAPSAEGSFPVTALVNGTLAGAAIAALALSRLNRREPLP